MKRSYRLFAALLAALLLCAMPMAALSELDIEWDGGLYLVSDGDNAGMDADLALDLAEPELDAILAPEPALAESAAAPVANDGEEDFDIEGGVVVGYHGAGGDIIIPDGVTAINDWVFAQNRALKGVSFPATLKRIGEGAFQGCANLADMTLPKGLTEIGDEAFKDCTSLKSLTIPGGIKSLQNTFKGCEALKTVSIEKGVEYLYDDVFAECARLTSLSLPEGLKHIGQGCFYGCAALKNVKIPKSVKALESYAFGYCIGLTSVKIPAGVKEFEGNPFIGCLNLKKIVVAADNARFVVSDDLLYTIDMKTLISCPGAKTSVKIAKGVTYIGDNAFDGCAKLKGVEIPQGVKRIGEWAFGNCTALEKVTIPASVTKIGEGAFIYENKAGKEKPLKASFIVEDGSYAHRYAKKEGLAVLIDLSRAKVSAEAQVYTGKAVKPDVKVVLNKKVLRQGVDYKVSFKNNKSVGKATVTVSGKGGYTGEATGTFVINPKKVTGLKLTAGSRQLTVSWDKAEGITGYQIQYSTKKNMSSAKKVTIARADKVKKTLKDLEAGSTYYVSIRDYKTVDGKEYWSDWSKVQSAKVK